MFFSIPRNLFFALLGFILTNLACSLQYSIFVNLPIPMMNMFNQSFFLHYGSYLSPMGESIILSSSTIFGKGGELTAILLVAPLLDKFGRRFVAIRLRFFLLVIGSILVLVGTLLPSFECFIISFFFTSLSFEIRFFATTLFITECTPDHIRGFVTILQSIAEVAGGVLGMTLARPSILGTEDRWWQLSAMAVVLNILAGSYLFWIPETPKRLISLGKRDEAKRSLLHYHGKDADSESLLQSYEKEVHMASSQATMSWRDVWEDETMKKSVLLILAFYLAINLSPYVSEMMFSTLIQMQMGLTQNSIMTLNSFSRVLALPMSFPVSYAIDRVGRRPIIFAAFSLLFFKSILMSFGLSVAFFSGPSLLTIGIAVFNDLLSAIISSLGLVLIASLFVCELTPLNARVAVSQICNLVPSVVMIPFLVALPPLLNTFPPVIYIYPIFLLPPLMVYIYRNLPETKGRKVCDILQDFDYCVRSRAPTRLSMISVDEFTPLLRKSTHLL